MKKSQFLAVLALVMALGLGIPAFLSASAEEGQPEATPGSIERNAPEGVITPNDSENNPVTAPTSDENISVAAVDDLASLQAALASAAETVIINQTIPLAEDLALDFQGKTLKLADGLHRMFAIERGNITLKNGILVSNDDLSQTGDAILWVTGSDADTDFDDYTTLTIESTLKISTQNSYGLAVHYLSDKHLARGLTINFAGEIEASYGISVNGNIQDTSNAPVINLTGTVTSTADDLAVFAAGYAEWHLNGATLTGATPLGLKAGKFVLENSTLKATGAYQQLEATGSGMSPNGTTFQIENNPAYAGRIDIEVKSGTYESIDGPVFSEYGNAAARATGSNLERLAISGGTFTSAANMPVFSGVSPAETVITGGNFSSDEDLEDYLKSDQTLVKDENGNFVIQTVDTPVTPDNPSDGNDPSDKPATKPDPDQKPGSSSPDTGILATIEHAANAVGALGTTIITGVLVASGAALAWLIGYRRRKASKTSRAARLDRVEIKISTPIKPRSKAPKSASKSTRKPASKSRKTSPKPSRSPKPAPSRKSTVSSSKSAKTSKKR